MVEWSKNTYWKILLIVLGGLILLATIMYSNFLASNLKENEEKNISLYTEALKRLVATSSQEEDLPDSESDADYREFLEMVRDSFPLPVIAEDEVGNLEGFNFDKENAVDESFLKKKKEEFLRNGGKPIIGSGYASKIYCLNSPLLFYIKLFPLAQALLVGLYIALGYILFSSSRKSEQNRVWAGMAKETAHQLGTPISAILGWIEYLKESNVDKLDKLDVIEELTKDVNRLELVADRFSKIGSDPVLESSNLFNELEEAKEYLQRRSPRKVSFEFEKPPNDIMVPINKHLFHWVIENLVRNSLDAMDGKGLIKCKCYILGENAIMELSDTGHGIPSNKFKSIFKPGYSTKKRGWGLGLSLAKRIINQYHKGNIYVKSSKPNEETTFVISLPMKSKQAEKE
jgi:nitrogen fixation/metabolism regulation signal transduction histidine kinase